MVWAPRTSLAKVSYTTPLLKDGKVYVFDYQFACYYLDIANKTWHQCPYYAE